MTRDRSTGLIALVLGIAIAIATSQLPDSMIKYDIGPKAFPYMVSGSLILCGILLVITGKKKGNRYFSIIEFKRLLSLAFVIILYCVFMLYLGYVVPTITVLFVMSTMFSDKGQVSVIHRLVFSAVITVLVYLVFTYVFRMKLPTATFF